MTEQELLNKYIKSEPIAKGWSEDNKYCVAKADGTRYLIRISPLSQYENKKAIFSMMEQIAALNVPMCIPIEYGVCEDSVYCIHSWIDGVDLETILPISSESSLPETEQYGLGIQAGKIAKKIHAIPIPEPKESWAEKFNRVIDTKIKEYHECGLHFKGDNYIFDYIKKNRHLLMNRVQCFLLSDFNIKNMMYKNGKIKIIDFEYYNIGDPWNEFNCIVWSAMASPYFATGQLQGYFDGEPPMEFFRLLALYNAILLLSLISSWAITSDLGRNATLKLSRDILQWFNNMQNPVPIWYTSVREEI